MVKSVKKGTKIQFTIGITVLTLASIALFRSENREAYNPNQKALILPENRQEAPRSDLSWNEDVHEPVRMVEHGPDADPLSPPKYVESDVDRLQMWLLAIPLKDFSLLLNSNRLDRLVKKIVAELRRRNLDRMAGSVEIDHFLTGLNSRIEMAGR